MIPKVGRTHVSDAKGIERSCLFRQYVYNYESPRRAWMLRRLCYSTSGVRNAARRRNPNFWGGGSDLKCQEWVSEKSAWELCNPGAPMPEKGSVLHKVLPLPGVFAPEDFLLLRYSDDRVGDEGGEERLYHRIRNRRFLSSNYISGATDSGPPFDNLRDFSCAGRR